MVHRLEDLPDDVLFLILSRLECARDVAALGLSCRKLHHLVSHDGWRIFVKSRFPSLTVPNPAAGCHTWQQLAESMTWQSRCWDRRSLQFQALVSYRRGRPQPIHAGLFVAVVDAHLETATQQELVVWGAGEDLVARYRGRLGSSWHRFDGKASGLKPPYDDVKAIKIVEHGGGQAILTGRFNGQLSLVSAAPDRFGQRIAELNPVPHSEVGSQLSSEQEGIISLDVVEHGSRKLIAAATRSCLRIYGLPGDGAFERDALTTYDLKDSILDSSSARLGRARWMEQGTSIALALAGSKDPLRYLALTPSGWSHHSSAKNAEVASQFDIKYDRTICPNSLEPVHARSGARGGTSLLLSAWRDSTIRLQDLRTPSPFDAVYQDNVDPWSNTETLMAYGTERFVAGGEGLTIKIFDFRWTKGYYHTSGLSCLDRAPFPAPHQPFLKPPASAPEVRAVCDHVRGLPCRWHELSRRIHYRPNVTYFVSDPSRSIRTSSVWSLARASDVSPNFYLGLSGCVIEANLEQSDTAMVDPNFGFHDWRAAPPPESGYSGKPLVPSLMEIGDGYAFKWNDQPIVLPNLMPHRRPRVWRGVPGLLKKHHRLDDGYQLEGDFDDLE